MLSYLVVPKYPDALTSFGVCSPKTGSNRDDVQEMRTFHLSGFTTQRTQHGEHSRNSGNSLVHVNQRCLKQLTISPKIRQNNKLTQAERLDFWQRWRKGIRAHRRRMRRQQGAGEGGQMADVSVIRQERKTWNRKAHHNAENTMETSTSAYGVSVRVSQSKTGILTPSAHIFSCDTDSLLTPRQLNTIFCTSRPLSPAL